MTDERDPLIGRLAELASVEAALLAHRLVTITGLGGVGKTRLAREVVERRTSRGELVSFVDLAPVTTPAGVLDAIAARIRAGETASRDLEAAVVERLGATPNVLVLDNLEHVMECRMLLGRLLEAAGSLTILATSRLALGLEEEWVLRLESLVSADSETDIETAPATQLFLRRARDHGNLRTLDPKDAPAVVEVCRRLDGLPLAIELAAAWTGVLTPRAIVRRIDDSSLPLADEHEPRHVSLEQVVVATLALTSDADRRVFDRLGVFAGTFDDAAVAAICTEPDVLAALRHLAAASLVRAGADEAGEPWFTLLETVRAIARRRLAASGALAEAEARHGAWYAARATRAADDLRSRTFNNADASARIADLNVVAAFERAVDRGDAELAGRLAAALGSYGIQAGILRESEARVRRALATGEASPGTRSDVLMALVNLRAALGELNDQVPEAHEALALARQAGSDIRTVRALIVLGSWTRVESIDRLTEAGELAERIGYTWGALTAWNNLGNALADSRRYEQAIDVYSRAIRLAESMGDVAGAGVALGSRGAAELELGNADRALADAQEAHRRLPADGGGSVSYRVWAGTTLAIAEAAAGLDARAAATLAGTTDLVVQLDSPPEVDGWLDAAFAVLASPHPNLAARCLGALDVGTRAEGSIMSSSPLNRRIAARIERSIGRHQLALKRAEGQAMDRRVLFEQLADVVRTDAGRGDTRVVAPYGALTARERSVLVLLGQGRSDREIGAQLGITPKTASVHVANLKAKLGVDTRVEAVLFARDHLGPDA